MNKQMREVLIDAYLDYLNNYVSYKTYAEHNGLFYTDALELIELGKRVFNSPHPDE